MTIVERTSVAAAASGKGGGFLARGWGSGPTRPLHEVSFDLHAELAKTLDLKTYRKIKTLSVTGELGLRGWPPADKPAKAPFSPDAPAWLDKENTGAAKQQSPTKEGKRRRKRRGKGKGKGGGGALGDHDEAGPPPPPDVLGRGA